MSSRPGIGKSASAPATKRARLWPKAMSKKKKKTSVTELTVIPRGPFPRRLRNTVVYEDTISISMASGTSTPFRCALNGLYDPNISGVGHQPMYFDQLMGIYKHYHVISSKTTISPASVSANQYMYVFHESDDSTVVYSAYNAERPGAVTLCGMGAYLSGKTLVYRYSSFKTFGKESITDPELQGNATANPSELSYGHLTVIPIPASGTPTETIPFRIRMEFYVEWSELYTDLNGS